MTTRDRVAAVQGTPVFCDRDATIEKVGAADEGSRRRRARALVAFPEALRARPTPTGSGARRRGPTASGTPAGPTRPSTCPGPRATRSARSRPSTRCYLAIPVNERDGGTIYNTILLLRPRRRVPRQAPQAHADRRRAARVGSGRRLDAARSIDTPFGRVGGLDLLGELHAARARRDVRAGRRHPARADVGQLRRVGRVDAPHRQGGSLLRARHHVVPARAPTCPPSFPGRDDIYGGDDDWMSRGNTVIVDPYGDDPRGTDQRDRRHPLRRRRHRRRCAGRAASSTSSATTRAPTCSSSA